MTSKLQKILNSRKDNPSFKETEWELYDLIKNPYCIPSIKEVRRIIKLNHLTDMGLSDQSISLALDLVKEFPNFHSYLVNIYGEEKFPEYDLPLVIFSKFSRYVWVLIRENKMEEIDLIIWYVDTLIHENPTSLEYVREFLAMSDLFSIEERRTFYNKLTPNIKHIFDTYFADYLIG